MSSKAKVGSNPAVEHSWDAASRTISIRWKKSNAQSRISVSPRYGEVLSIECKKDYIVLHTEEGRAAYDYEGRIPWSRLRVEVMKRLCEDFRSRVKFEIIYFRGSGRCGARGRIYVDGEIVGHGLYNLYNSRVEFTTRELGQAIADYLELAPAVALRSNSDLISAISLLDNDLNLSIIDAVAQRDHPVWRAFYELRTTTQIRGEQVDADQPATVVDSKAEGSEKPSPESEGRSQ